MEMILNMLLAIYLLVVIMGCLCFCVFKAVKGEYAISVATGFLAVLHVCGLIALIKFGT